MMDDKISLTIGSGFAGGMPRRWGDSQTWSITVDNNDTLQVIMDKLDEVAGSK